MLSVRTVRHDLHRGWLCGLPGADRHPTIARGRVVVWLVAWFALRRGGAGGCGSGSRWVRPDARRACRAPNRPSRSTAPWLRMRRPWWACWCCSQARSGSSSGSCSTLLGGGLGARSSRGGRVCARGLSSASLFGPRACVGGRRHGSPGSDALVARRAYERDGVRPDAAARRRRSGALTALEVTAWRRVSAAVGDWSRITSK
jgi:hypothetical protein